LRRASPACDAKDVRGAINRSVWILLAAMLLVGVHRYSTAQTGNTRALQIDSFETVWTTIRDKHWDTHPGGLDWGAIHAEYRPMIEAAKSEDEARTVIRAMLSRLGQTHFAIFPAGVAEEISNQEGDGNPGFDVRVLGGQVIVTEVYQGESVHTGWELLRAGTWDLPNLVGKLRADPAIHDYALVRAVQSRITGPVGATRHFVFRSAGDAKAELDLTLRTPRGELAAFGNLSPQRVWFEFRRLNNTGLIRFNEFLDLTRLIPAFGNAVQACAACNGLIIDVRGNPGGIGGMAMGMAGWLVNHPDQRLGTMYMRGATLKFIINPRADAYTGPLAILVDETSASTSEIFAGGLQDLHRARIFGTHTAGAALPSVVTRLPNGDGFQYAVANYVSEGGKTLEGNGVTPDVEVRLTRETLLAGHDAVMDTALQWIRQQRQ